MSEGISINEDLVISKIFYIRNYRVIFDHDLAEMYGVETKRLNEGVKRNIERFPEDCMFQLTEEEYTNLRSHFATSSWGGRRTLPYVFTEHGVLMLSSVLNSSTAIQVNIRIMRIYNKLREMNIVNSNIVLKLKQLEKQMLVQNNHVNKHEEEITLIFEALKLLLTPERKEMKKIGFK
jgi:hypothetical protein